jgi:hypothetical protein
MKQHQQRNAYSQHHRRHPELAVGQHGSQVRFFQEPFPFPDVGRSRAVIVQRRGMVSKHSPSFIVGNDDGRVWFLRFRRDCDRC